MDKRKLVICEKPSVVRALATALGCHQHTKTTIEGNGYVISWCLGHLVETAQAAAYGNQYIRWSYEALPIIPEEWRYTVKPTVRDQFNVLKKLMKYGSFSEVVNACDAGREGELIFRLVYEKAGCKLPMKRLWISSMEEEAIREGFAHLRDGKEFDDLYSSALARQQADWLVGINGTRLFSVLYGNSVRKVGRVQSPTLAMIVMRDQEIREFKRKPFYTVQLEASGLQAVSERLEKKEDAVRLAGVCDKGPVHVLRVSREEKSIPAPKPFDLTSLQQEANRLFGYTAKQTLEYTQSLYEQKLCTYPRTDSRYLSDDMGETAGKVLEAIQCSMPFAAKEDPDFFNIKGILNSSKVTDHHAIIPTVKIAETDQGSLPVGEQKILALIASGLMCSVMQPARETIVKADLKCAGAKFTASKRFVTDPGWKRIYEVMKRQYCPDREQDSEDSDLNAMGCFSNLAEGMQFPVRAKVVESYTKPPKRYTEATLLSAMENAGVKDMAEEAKGDSKAAGQNGFCGEPEEQRNKADAGQTEAKSDYVSMRHGLGTPATRADIIEKLIADKYVTREKKCLTATDPGIELVTILPETLRSPKLTADWENALQKISKGQLSSNEFLNGIKTMIRELVERYDKINTKG